MQTLLVHFIKPLNSKFWRFLGAGVMLFFGFQSMATQLEMCSDFLSFESGQNPIESLIADRAQLVLHQAEIDRLKIALAKAQSENTWIDRFNFLGDKFGQIGLLKDELRDENNRYANLEKKMREQAILMLKDSSRNFEALLEFKSQLDSFVLLYLKAQLRLKKFFSTQHDTRSDRTDVYIASTDFAGSYAEVQASFKNLKIKFLEIYWEDQSNLPKYFQEFRSFFLKYDFIEIVEWPAHGLRLWDYSFSERVQSYFSSDAASSVVLAKKSTDSEVDVVIKAFTLGWRQ